MATLPDPLNGGPVFPDVGEPWYGVTGSSSAFLKSHSFNEAQIGPGCTSFPSASCPDEVIIPEKAGILPEQFRDLRRELQRSYLAMLPGLTAGRDVVLEVGGNRQRGVPVLPLPQDSVEMEVSG